LAETTRVAVIGAGAHACRAHYPSLARLDDAEVVAAADLSEERLKAVREQYGIPAGYSDYRAMLRETEPDAVYVILPHLATYPVVLDCLKMGLNVFLEKPPGVTLEQTRFLARCAESHGCITMVGFQRRYSPQVLRAAREARAHGGIDLLVCRFFKNATVVPLYEYHESKGVDILTCDTIHAVDLLRGLGGEVEAISSEVRSVHIPCPSLFVALIRFKSGTTGVLEANWVSGRRQLVCEMHARGFVAHVDVENETRVYTENSDDPERRSAGDDARGEERFVKAGFLAESQRFIECIRTGDLPVTHLGDSVKTMELVDRIYHSGF